MGVNTALRSTMTLRQPTRLGQSGSPYIGPRYYDATPSDGILYHCSTRCTGCSRDEERICHGGSGFVNMSKLRGARNRKNLLVYNSSMQISVVCGMILDPH